MRHYDRNRKHPILIGLLVVAALGLTALIGNDVHRAYGATAKHAAQQASKKPAPELLNSWGPEPSYDNVYDLLYDYGGGDWLYYPQISKKADAIPIIKTYLTLPAGANITKNKVLLTPPNNGKYYKKVKYWGPKSPSLNPKQLNATTWLLSFRGLRNSPNTNWGFWIDWGTATSQCLKAVAHPMYYKRVKRNGRYIRVLKPIPRAPMQTGDYPNGCSQQ